MNDIATRIIQSVLYAAVATTDVSGQPWNSPVYVTYDQDLNFYWASGKASQHSSNIRGNPQVFLALYDSSVAWGEGCGVFIQATAEELNDHSTINTACSLRKMRVPQADQAAEEFTGGQPRRMYRATPQKIWINQDVTVNGSFIDGRAELDLLQLRKALQASLSKLHTAKSE